MLLQNFYFVTAYITKIPKMSISSVFQKAHEWKGIVNSSNFKIHTNLVSFFVFLPSAKNIIFPYEMYVNLNNTCMYSVATLI